MGMPPDTLLAVQQVRVGFLHKREPCRSFPTDCAGYGGSVGELGTEPDETFALL